MKTDQGRRNRGSRLASVTIRGAVALAGVAFATNARAECSREMLQELASTYVEAQSTGTPATLPLGTGAYKGEIDVSGDISRDVLAKPLTVYFTRSFYDTKQRATFTEFVAASHPHTNVIHTRMEAKDKGQIT